MNDQIENYELDMNNIPVHIAFIMDGNGRWAKKRMAITKGQRQFVRLL